MPKVSIIIPTHNRPEMLKQAIASVLAQTYQDFEIIIVDDGDISAEEVVKSFADNRIKYIKHQTPHKGGSAARNTGIKAAQGKFLAFLDDDDEWLPEKLEIQMREFENTPKDVGFCFSAVINDFGDGRKQTTTVPDGIDNLYELALRRFKGFLTVTLVVKKAALEEIGLFDEILPSHQDPDLIIRLSKKYQGLGINKPLVKVNMALNHEHIGGNLKKRIRGRERILEKYFEEFKKRPKVLAYHYSQLGFWYRDSDNFIKAREYFRKALSTNFSYKYLLNLFSLFLKGRFYKLIKR